MNSFETIRPYIFVALFIGFALLETIFPERKRSFSKRNWTNVILFFSGIAILRVVFPLGLAMVANFVIENDYGIMSLYKLPAVIEIPIVLLVFDFFIYWQHRFSHSIPFFWRFHHIHHSDRMMDLTTGIRFHPGEIFLSGLYKIVLIFLFSPNIIAYLLYETFLSAFALFNHSNIRIPKTLDRYLRYIFATPSFHLPHHSPIRKRTNSNYGNILSIWDYIFKTYDDGYNETFGLKDESEENSKRIAHLLQRPFS